MTENFQEIYDRLVAEDDARVGYAPPGKASEPEPLKVGWLIGDKGPWLGGEYYRATRPAMLSHARFGWHTVVSQNVGSVDGSPRVFLNGNAGPVDPDVIVVRPLGKANPGCAWSLPEMVERAHAAGQWVVADLDDDIWAHEDWTPSTRPQDDEYETWCWSADAWLVSTETIGQRIHELGGAPDDQVRVAPNCFEPPSDVVTPVAGRRLGTRLWLSGRMMGDLDIYAACVGPLLDELDLTFTHIGHEPSQARSFPESCGFTRERTLQLPSVVLPELSRWLAATTSIGMICVADHPYNRAKTLTHAVELASAGLPLIIASDLSIYDDAPGVCDPDPKRVRDAVEQLLEPRTWKLQSRVARRWAQAVAAKSEADYLASLKSTVEGLLAP